MIEEKVPQSERLVRLNNSVRRQMKVLKGNKNIKELELLQKQVNEESELLIDENRRVLTKKVSALFLYIEKERLII